MDPPDASTTTVEVPAVKLPAEVSIDRTVTTLPFAIKVPPLATVRVPAPIAKSEPEVLRVVVPEPP